MNFTWVFIILRYLTCIVCLFEIYSRTNGKSILNNCNSREDRSIAYIFDYWDTVRLENLRSSVLLNVVFLILAFSREQKIRITPERYVSNYFLLQYISIDFFI